MDHNLLRLFLCVLLPGVLSAGVSLLNQRSSFGRLPYAVRQITIGVCFGGLAVLFTEFGINIGSATINVRDAAPLCAGLLFGGPAGIIAGVIGGVERWFAALWGAGEFTRTACSAATILAGLLGAAVRRFLLDGKRPSWGYGAMVGVTIEVLHMLLVLLTNMEELQAAFYVVERCTVIMTLANALSITLAIGVTALLENRQAGGRPKNRKKKISEIVQARLLICIAIAFVLTSFFTYSVQSTIAGNSTDYYLSQSIMDIPTSIHNTSESLMLQYTRWIGSDIDSGRREGAAGETLYDALAKEYEILELYIVDRDGKVTYSLNRAFIGFNLAEEEQTAEFLPILSGKTDDCILEYQPSFPNPKVFRQYVGVALEDGGLVLVGYDKVLIEEFDVHISTTAKNRHVGQDGFVLLADRNGTIVSDGLEENGQMRPYIVLVQYGHEKDINDALSEYAGGRVIWGGDRTIGEIRKSPLQARGVEITFADRYSLAVIDADKYLSECDKKKTAQDFYNDTYLTDQNACTSPRAVIWTRSRICEAKECFWSELYALVKEKYELQPVQAVNTLTSAFLLAAAREGVRKEPAQDNRIMRMHVETLDDTIMELKDNSGYFFEYDCENIDELEAVCSNTHCQTITYIGESSMFDSLLAKGLQGVDRIVPMGQSMDFEFIWDGYQLLQQLSRTIRVR